MEIRPLTEAERKYTYTQSMQLLGQTGCIGHLRGDTGGLFNAEKFVIDNGLGEFTGLTGRSGYREFPLYLFNADKLRELCPEQMAIYERSIGVVSKEAEKKKSR